MWLTGIIQSEFGHDQWDRVDAMTFEEVRDGAVPGVPPDPGVLPTTEAATMLLDL